MISLYTVQAFSDHEKCVTESGYSITISYEIAFRLGLGVIVAETVNTNILGIYLKFLQRREMKKQGYIQQMKVMMV